PPDGCRVVLPVCYEEVVQLGDTATNYQIAAGDRVFVPARTFCEGLFGRNKPQCPPCGRGQVSCAGMHGDGRDCSAYWATSAPAAAPHYQTAPPPAVRPAAPQQPMAPAQAP